MNSNLMKSGIAASLVVSKQDMPGGSHTACSGAWAIHMRLLVIQIAPNWEYFSYNPPSASHVGF